MLESPKSLTATIHVRFNYKEREAEPIGERQVEIINRILDRTSELDPELQDLVVKFASYLNEIGQKEDRQSSSD